MTTTDGVDLPAATQMTHKQAINRMKDIQEEIERISAKKEISTEDEARWVELRSEFEDLDGHRKSLERAADLAKLRSAFDAGTLRAQPGVSYGNGSGYDKDPILEPDSIEDKRFRNPWDLSEVRSFGRSKEELGQELRARALAAIEKMQGADDAVRAGGTKIVEKWDDQDSTIARMVLATSSPEYLRAWSKMATGRGNLLSQVEQQALERAMSLTDSAGGYLVPFQLDPTVIITSAGSLNQIRRIARQVIATGDVWNGVSAGQVTWAFAAEATESSDNSPTFAQPTVQVHKAQGFVPISIEALADEANVTQEVARLLAFGREALESDKLINGSGTGEPFGIKTALNGTASNVSSANAGFAIADLYLLDNGLPARYRGNASWLAHRAMYNRVRAFDTAGGAGLWVQLPNDVPGQLIGRNAYEAEAMPSALTAGTDNLIYGDFSNYVIADRVGMTVEFIPHLVGTNRRPTGQRGWYAYYRVGADSVNDDGFRMLQMI